MKIKARLFLNCRLASRASTIRQHQTWTMARCPAGAEMQSASKSRPAYFKLSLQVILHHHFSTVLSLGILLLVSRLAIMFIVLLHSIVPIPRQSALVPPCLLLAWPIYSAFVSPLLCPQSNQHLTTCEWQSVAQARKLFKYFSTHTHMSSLLHNLPAPIQNKIKSRKWKKKCGGSRQILS